jgi:phage tail protein X
MKPKLRKQYVVTKHKKDIIDIAVEVYGNGGMAGKILQANPGVYELKAGMVLNLPPDEPQKAASADQVMRLDYAGLRDLPSDAKSEIKSEEVEEAIPPKELVAREVINLFKESGLLAHSGDITEEVGQPDDFLGDNEERIFKEDGLENITGEGKESD